MSFCIFFLVGILIQHSWPVPAVVILALVVILLVMSLTVSKSFQLLPILWAVTLVCGMLRLANVQSRQNQIENQMSRFDGQQVELEGRVISSHPIEEGFKYVVMNERITMGTQSLKGDIRVHLFAYESDPLRIGERIRVMGRLRALRRPRNPGQFDFRSFYQRQNIWADVFQHRSVTAAVIDSNYSFVSRAGIERVRRVFKTLFDDTVGGDAGKLVTALIVGLRKEIPKEISRDFADTGVIHILAVSGLHVGYVLVIFIALVKLLRIPYRWDKIVLILALVSYAVFSGGRSSVWRATAMASLYVVAPLFQREASLWNIIAASALGLLIYNPDYLFDAGFLLSFSAVISIVLFYRQFDRALPVGIRVSAIRSPFLKGIMALMIVSLSAQIGTLPFTWSFFNRIPLVSVVANVIIIPIVGVIVSTGFAIVLLGSLIPQMGWVLGNTAWLLGEITFWITATFSDLPFAYVDLATPSFLNIVQYGTAVTTIFLILRRDLWKKAVLVGVFTLNLFVWPWALQREMLDVIFLDVGQGDAAVIRVSGSSGTVRTILLDAGRKGFKADSGEQVVLPVLNHLGVKKIDLLVMSHPHSDHIGGVETVLQKIEVGEVWDTFSNYHSNMYDRIMGSVFLDSIPYRRTQAGHWSPRFLPAEIYVLHPDSLWASRQRNVNNVSIVMKLVYGDASFLFAGDLERGGDKEVVSFGDLIRATVLKAEHHGSVTSTTDAFLNLVQPEFVVVSVGERNKFNHPSEEVLARIRSSGSQVLRTDIEGAVWFKSNGRAIWRYDWR